LEVIMRPDIQPIPRPEWSPLPFEGCRNVEGKVLLRLPHLSLALLRFAAGGTIHEHPADIDIDVICLEGHGMTSVGGVAAELRVSEQVRWPAGLAHRLWTEDSEMVTLMVEYRPAQAE
jgi:quercetin dioxygenase-like cupin family protein